MKLPYSHVYNYADMIHWTWTLVNFVEVSQDWQSVFIEKKGTLIGEILWLFQYQYLETCGKNSFETNISLVHRIMFIQVIPSKLVAICNMANLSGSRCQWLTFKWTRYCDIVASDRIHFIWYTTRGPSWILICFSTNLIHLFSISHLWWSLHGILKLALLTVSVCSNKALQE